MGLFNQRLIIVMIALSMSACAGLRPKRTNFEKSAPTVSAVSTDSKPLLISAVEAQGLNESKDQDPSKAPASTPEAESTSAKIPEKLPEKVVAETPVYSELNVKLVDKNGHEQMAPDEVIVPDEKPLTKVEVPSASEAKQAAADVKNSTATNEHSHDAHVEQSHDQNGTAHAGSTDHAHKREAGPVPPEQALGWLKNGNTRFMTQKLRKDGQGPSDIRRLASGQKPHSIVLSCSDSRVPPEVLFDQKLGEIFVVRTAGQSLDAMAIASIEYAVSHLGSNLIVVMGHESCGAVKAAHGSFGGKDVGSPALNKLVADIQPRIKDFEGRPLTSGALQEGWANVTGVARDLVERSEIVRQAFESGEVRIEQALYHLGDGHVEWKK